MSLSEDLGIAPAATDPQPPPAEGNAPAPDPQPTNGDGGNTANQPEIIESPALADDQLGHLVQVKVNGEDEWVPVSDAAAGYQRQADYTAKTQALAEQRRELDDAVKLADAFKADPKFTIETLAKSQGLKLVDGSVAPSGEEEYMTPEERRFADQQAEIDSLKSQVQATQAQSHLEKQMADLETQVGGSVDRDALVRHMAATGVSNVRAAYADMNFDAIPGGRAQAANEAAKNAVLDQKREASVIHRPTQTSAGSQSPSAAEVPSSLREAAQMAWEGRTVSAEQSLPEWIQKGF